MYLKCWRAPWTLDLYQQSFIPFSSKLLLIFKKKKITSLCTPSKTGPKFSGLMPFLLKILINEPFNIYLIIYKWKTLIFSSLVLLLSFKIGFPQIPFLPRFIEESKTLAHGCLSFHLLFFSFVISLFRVHVFMCVYLWSVYVYFRIHVKMCVIIIKSEMILGIFLYFHLNTHKCMCVHVCVWKEREEKKRRERGVFH